MSTICTFPIPSAIAACFGAFDCNALGEYSLLSDLALTAYLEDSATGSDKSSSDIVIELDCWTESFAPEDFSHLLHGKELGEFRVLLNCGQ